MQLEGITEGPGPLGGFNMKILMFFFVGWIIIYFCIWKGVATSANVAKVTVISPYIFFLLLLVNVLRLPGCFEGFKFLLVPNLKELFKLKTWYYALD